MAKKTNRGRRRFLQTISAAPLIPAAIGTAITETPAEAAAPIPDQTNALAQVVQARFGEYLKAGDLDDIKRVIERNLRYAEAISKVKITNGDEPDFTFYPYEGE
jgi:lipoprotein-anchoring transpeptidase ErfK/SrfK